MTCDRNEYLWGVPDDRPPNADAVAPPCAPPRRQADQRAPQRLRHVADSRRSFSLLVSPIRVLTLSPAEALDQWFENLQNYEATLVCFFFRFSLCAHFRAGRYGRCLARCQLQRRARRHRAVSVFLFLHFVSSCFHRVQGPLRGRAHRCPLQSPPAFNPGPDPFLHHCSPADGQGRPHDCPPQPRRRLHAEPDGSLLFQIEIPRPQVQHPPLPHSTRFCSEPPVPRSRQQLKLSLSRFSRKLSLCRSTLFRRCRNPRPPARQTQSKRRCCPSPPHLRSCLAFRNSRCPCLLGCRSNPRPGLRVQPRLPGKHHLPSQEQRLFRLPSFSSPRSCPNRR